MIYGVHPGSLYESTPDSIAHPRTGGEGIPGLCFKDSRGFSFKVYRRVYMSLRGINSWRVVSVARLRGEDNRKVLVYVALALAVGVYVYLRLYALAGVLPDPYHPSALTLFIRVVDFIVGGLVFYLVARAVSGGA